MSVILPIANPADFATRMWRPALGWVGVLIVAGIGGRAVLGLPLPNVEEILTVLTPILTLAITRSFDKQSEAKAAAMIPDGRIISPDTGRPV